MKQCKAGYKSINIEPDGQLTPCCLISPMHGKGQTTAFELDACFDSELWKKLQSKNIQEDLCNYCIEQEKSSSYSVRSFMNKHLSDDSKTSLEYLNINLSNVCNFRCQTCHPSRSFKITREGISSKKHRLDSDYLKQVVSNNISSLKFVSFQGGEPFLYNNLFDLIKFVKQTKSSIYISVVTNLSMYPDWLDIAIDKKLIDRIKVSIDGVGNVAEYIRYGLDWNQFYKNLQRLRGKFENIQVSTTVSIFSIFNLNHTFTFLEKNNLGEIDLNLLCFPKYLDIKNLNQTAKTFFMNEVFLKFDDVIKSRLSMNKDLSDEYVANNLEKLDLTTDRCFKKVIPELYRFYHPPVSNYGS